MEKLTLFYATNRNHAGEQWHPTGYGTTFSADGMENLRFGKLTLEADAVTLANHLDASGSYGTGQGIELADYLTAQAAQAVISPYPEIIPDRGITETHQPGTVLGSRAMFTEIKEAMEGKSDLLLYIHGFNVSWQEAVGSAAALQEMLNNSRCRDPQQSVLVVLFTWPSDGQALPFVSYKSDRSEAKGSSGAFGRGLLKLRDFLFEVCKTTGNPCGRNIHLLCHSMGNYLLQEALQRIDDFTPGNALPRIFDQIFMCAPDVDDTVFEPDQLLMRLPELARCVTVYHNRQDKAMFISDYTKGNPERLGCNGAARPGQLHNKIQQVDCTPVVAGEGLVEHSYYLAGTVNTDIRLCLDGAPFYDPQRQRVRNGQWGNVWTLRRIEG
jgi:esterase/lipase superfamily enzyme